MKKCPNHCKSFQHFQSPSLLPKKCTNILREQRVNDLIRNQKVHDILCEILRDKIHNDDQLSLHSSPGGVSRKYDDPICLNVDVDVKADDILHNSTHDGIFEEIDKPIVKEDIL